jgi:hypothetical protein
MRFCASNPHTTVDLRVPGFEIIDKKGDLTAYQFLGQGTFLTLALRGQDITFIMPEDNGVEATRATCLRMCHKALGKHYDIIGSLRDSVGNLRFLPRRVE